MRINDIHLHKPRMIYNWYIVLNYISRDALAKRTTDLKRDEIERATGDNPKRVFNRPIK